MKTELRKTKALVSRISFFLLAITMVIASVLTNISSPKLVHAAVGTVSEYTLPTSGVNPGYLTLGPDNNIWYAGYSRIGKVTASGSITQYASVGNYHGGITKGSDGNLWYGEEYYDGYGWSGRIVGKTTSGTTVGQYNTAGIVSNVTLGADGNVWFIESGSGGVQKIGTISPAGVGADYQISSASYSCGQTQPVLSGLTTGSDGNIWFTIYCTGSNQNAIGKMSTSGSYTIYPILPKIQNLQPTGITAGPDGNLWFTELQGNKIGMITTSGAITQYDLPTANAQPYSITAGSDGALWFTERNIGKIGRITTSGIVSEYVVSDATSNSLHQITTGLDGAVWFTNGNEIGRMATGLSNQAISFSSVAPTNATVGGPTYTPTAFSTSGLPVAITVDSASLSVCSIDNSGKLSFQGAGTCTINANQTGNADYNPAAQVQQSFSVLPVDADTSITLTCPSTASVGNTVTCAIVISNNGPATINNAVVTLLAPSSLGGISASDGGSVSGSSILWIISPLASGASQTVTFNGTVSMASKAQFSASLLQTNPDSDKSNNIANSTLLTF